MSVQICEIRGYGYKFEFSDNLFSFINDDKESDFLDVINKNFSYYDFRDWQSQDKKNLEPLLAVITDGMCGEYKYVLYIEQVKYIENTHSDNFWKINPLFNEHIKEYAKQNIETFLQRKMNKEPQMFEFKHWE